MEKTKEIKKLRKDFVESYQQNGLNDINIEAYLSMAYDLGVKAEAERRVKPNRLKGYIDRLKRSSEQYKREDGFAMERILNLLHLDENKASELYWRMDTIVRDDFFELFTNDGKIKYNKQLLIDKLEIQTA